MEITMSTVFHVAAIISAFSLVVNAITTETLFKIKEQYHLEHAFNNSWGHLSMNSHSIRCYWNTIFSEASYQPVMYCNTQINVQYMFGNFLGWYLEAIACAEMNGLHFINLGHVEWSPFLNALPKAIVHQTPSNFTQKEQLDRSISRNCPWNPQPWEMYGAWSSDIHYIRKIINESFNIAFPEPELKSLAMSDFDYVSRNETNFPFIPDVVISIRCVDILRENLNKYGFLPYAIYKLLIKSKSIRSIYVLSEPKDYTKSWWKNENELNTYKKAQKYCDRIIHLLRNNLRSVFPRAVVGIRRGRTMESFQMLARSRFVICAPTTFCFWPGMINPHHVFLSPHRLFQNLTFIHPNFYWIKSPEAINLSEYFLRNATVAEILSHLMIALTPGDVVLSTH